MSARTSDPRRYVVIGALPPSRQVARRFTMSPVHHAEPAAVLAELEADPSVALAEELICFLPPAFGLKENVRLLEDIAEMVDRRV